MKNLLKISLPLFLVLCAVADASASKKPEFSLRTFNFGDSSFCYGVSPNGRYAIYCGYAPNNSLYYHFPHIIDLEEDITYNPAEGMDVYSAGLIVVSDTGRAGGTLTDADHIESPAIWSPAEGWKVLPYPVGQWEGGRVEAITADGKFAAGKVYKASMMIEAPALWSLEGTPKLVETKGCPAVNPDGSQASQIRFTDVSLDGRYVTGIVDFSYGGSGFIYDAERGIYQWNRPENETPLFEEQEDFKIQYYSGFTPSGRQLLCTAQVGGRNRAALYNLADGSYKILEDKREELEGITTFNDQGVYFCSSPDNTIVREWSVRKGKYWVSFNQILKQLYDTDIDSITGYEDVFTGTVMGVDSDGYTIGVMILPNTCESYVVELPRPIEELAAEVDLLADFSASPAAGTSFSRLRDVTLKFGRDVEVVPGAEMPYVVDEEGAQIAQAIKYSTAVNNPREVSISFRIVTLEDGKRYEVVIPAGTLRLPGDDEVANGELRFDYIGREAKPVELVSVTPDPANPMPRFSLSTNPLLFTFDTDVIAGENPGGTFLRVSEELGEEYLCDVAIGVGGRQAIVYPLLDQPLFLDNEYKLVLDAGSVTDVTGANGNEEICISLTGSYKREYNPDDLVLFFNDFNDGSWVSEFMFYEGDKLTPSTQMVNWGFLNGEQYPWWCVRSTETSSDWALASHSMYSPPGRSDDWLVTPQLFIPDDCCVLTFKSQSYIPGKGDRLKVLVFESDIMAGSISESFMEKMRVEAEVVYDEEQDPGAEPEILEGDWRENLVSLEKYSGKNIYIAFLNDNEDCSAVFLDDVKVSRDVPFAITLTNPTRVVCASEAKIEGSIHVENPGAQYNNVKLSLLDGNGDEVSQLALCEEAKGGELYEFSFPDLLILKAGRSNAFSIAVAALEGEEKVNYSYSSRIDNLAFSPQKRVVMEEGTGMDCPNCPWGHIMIEKLLDAHGARFIPLALHTYTGDQLGAGLAEYSEFLGLNAFPSAVIDRTGIYFPVSTVAGQAVYSDESNPLWWDVVARQLGQPADAALEYYEAPAYDTDARLVRLPVEVTFPLSQTATSLNLLVVYTEDGLVGHQQSNLYTSTDALAGEWGANGLYAKPIVRDYVFDHVVRSVWGATYAGTSGLIPSNVSASVPYRHVIITPIPTAVTDMAKAHAVVMLIDGATGQVVNSVSAPLAKGTGVAEMEATTTGDVYSLDGLLLIPAATEDELKNLTPGIYIRNGRRILVR